MITFNERASLAWNQRPDLIDRLSTSIYGGVGNYRDADGKWQPFPNCPASQLYNGSCVAFYADESVVIPAVSTLGILSNFEYSVHDEIEVFGNIWGFRKESSYNWGPYSSTFQISQSAAAGMVEGTVNDGLFDNHTGEVSLQFQLTDLGPETREIEANMFGGGLGIRGFLGEYDWELYITEDRSHKSDVQVNGAINKRAVTELMENGSFNPFATGAARGSLDDAEIAPFLLAENYSREITTQFTGPIYQLPTGTIEAAIGLIHLNEGFSAKNDPIVDRPEADGRSFSGANFSGYKGTGSRSVSSAFLEASIPAYDGLQIQAAARFDSYSDFGSTVNPKMAFRYQPIERLYIRGSARTGFKAPTLDELYRSQYSQFVRYTDRLLCPVDDDYNNNCRSKSMYIQAGGNPDLEEEGSESFSYGVGFEPINQLSFTADYWSILLKNTIGYQSLTALTEAEATGADLSKYAQITRDATTGEITNVVALNQNLGRKELKGLDYTINYRLNFDWGKFRFKTHYSNLLSYKNKDWPAAALEESAGTFGRPRWRAKNLISWTYSGVTTSWTTLITGPQNIDGADIGDYNEHGIHVRYQASWDAKIGLGVQNVFDRPIPSNEDRL